MRTKSFEPEKALTAAMLQFWESGYKGTSMQDLVERMEISRQSLYDTFGNKRTLFMSALEHYDQTRLQPRIQLLEAPDVSASEALRDYLGRIIESRENVPCGCLVTRTATEVPAKDRELRAALESCVAEFKNALITLVRHGQEAGEFRRDRPAEDWAACILMVAQGLNVMRRLPGQEEFLARSVESLMHSLSAQPRAA